jgi:hypothetical protein
MEDKLSVEEILVAQKIYEFRGQKVMLSGDLAELYEVEVKVLNQHVRRNINRFPRRYMFKLTMEEYREASRSHFVTLKRGQHSKYPPYAFTEHGVLMLSSILRSERAEKVSLVIIDTFVKLRTLLSTHVDLVMKMEEIERSVFSHDDQIVVLFEQLKHLLGKKQQHEDQESRSRIGFKRVDKESRKEST